MNAAALNRPDYGKMLKSWAIFALLAFAFLWLISSLFKDPGLTTRGEVIYGYDYGLIFISVSLSLIFSVISLQEDERTAAACSFMLAGLLALTILEFGKNGRENFAFGIILAGMTIIALCLSLMWLKGKKYSTRWYTAKAYGLCTFLIIVFAGGAVLAIKYFL